MPTFRREERLKSEKLISGLFKKGKSFGQYPIRLIWLPLKVEETAYPIQFSVSVPKRKFPKAVDRNQIKRLIRESYRLHKSRVYDVLYKEKEKYAFMVLYVAKEKQSFDEIDQAMGKMLRRFLKKRHEQ